MREEIGLLSHTFIELEQMLSKSRSIIQLSRRDNPKSLIAFCACS